MSAVIVDGTLVAEIGEEVVQVRVDSPAVSELEPGAAIELKIGDDSRHYLGTVLAVGEDGNITVLVDPVAMTEQEALVEDMDSVLGGIADDVPPIRGMVR